MLIKTITALITCFFIYAIFFIFWPASELRDTSITTIGDPQAGRYLLRAAGCYACHTNTETNGKPFAGGVLLKTEFGTFVTPNISMSKQFGIGNWTLTDFEKALRRGISPNGRPYYPSFPYLAYAGISDADIADLWAAFQQTTAIEQDTQPHQLNFPFNVRQGLWGWYRLFYQPTNKAQTRGEYLVEALGHCAECHTPRNFLGALVAAEKFSGNDHAKSPGIRGIDLIANEWTQDDLAYALESGETPDGDLLGDSMAEVIEHSTSYLSQEDLTAIADYLYSSPAVNQQ